MLTTEEIEAVLNVFSLHFLTTLIQTERTSRWITMKCGATPIGRSPLVLPWTSVIGRSLAGVSKQLMSVHVSLNMTPSPSCSRTHTHTHWRWNEDVFFLLLPGPLYVYIYTMCDAFDVIEPYQHVVAAVHAQAVKPIFESVICTTRTHTHTRHKYSREGFYRVYWDTLSGKSPSAHIYSQWCMCVCVYDDLLLITPAHPRDVRPALLSLA